MPKLSESLRLMAYLEAMPDRTLDFESFEVASGRIQHLFTDGACRKHAPYTWLAAWSVQNASTGQLIAAAPLRGGKQTAHRAELQALYSAVAWGNCVNSSICLWSDSSNNVDTLEKLLQGGLMSLPEQELDLWTHIAAELEHRKHLATYIRWIPSHLRQSSLEDDFEAWISHWNDRADTAAVLTNLHRDPLCLQLAKEKSRQYERLGALLKQLRAFYLAVADDTAPKQSSHSTTEAPVVRTVDADILAEHLPIG